MEFKLPEPTLSLILFSTLSLTLISIPIFSILKRVNKKTEHPLNNPLNEKPDPTHFTHWDDFLDPEKVLVNSESVKKKKKKRKKKKKKIVNGGENEEENEKELVCLYPFTTSSSVTQRKIKQKYDELVKCNGSKGLTLAQVGNFVNCLDDARNGLKHKSEIIQRKFTITKALLLKADRSSFNRLSQQINKLELEQKRLKEDSAVYNWLQQQLKVSPAYKKMVEIGVCMELKAKNMELAERTDDEASDISFEELLEQEKKDSFWQRNGKLRSCSG